MITALDIEKVITDKGPMSNIKGPLISSQRYLDKAKVNNRAARFKRFIVSVYPIVLRGQQYTILMDATTTTRRQNWLA